MIVGIQGGLSKKKVELEEENLLEKEANICMTEYIQSLIVCLHFICFVSK